MCCVSFCFLTGCLTSQKHWDKSCTRAREEQHLCKAPLSAGYVLILKIVWPSQCLLLLSCESPSPPFFFHRWIFCSINPTDQVGFVNVLNFNTLGHLSLRPNPGSVSHQTSHFLIWFGSKVAQERAKGEQGVVVVVVMEWSWVEWVGGVGEWGWGGSAT